MDLKRIALATSLSVIFWSLTVPASGFLPDTAGLQAPKGFKISIYVSGLPNARSMAMSPEGTLYVGTNYEGKVYAIPDRDKNGKIERTELVADGLNNPNGVAFYDGALYVAETSRLIKFPEIEKQLLSKTKPHYEVVRDDLPKETHHGFRYLRIGQEGEEKGWAYISIGAPCNTCQKDEDTYATILRYSLDGKKREIVARGLRNSMGFDFHPQTHELWMTDNGRDLLGDEKPADELNHLTKPGEHFGFPYCHQGDLPDPDLGKLKKCDLFTPPVQKLGPHVASLGMVFYNGKMFPEKYRGQIFIAEHGSWNRSKLIGYRVSMVTLDGTKAVSYEPFATGWLQPGEKVRGRPVDLLVKNDGSLLVSDDKSGMIYRISYDGP